MKNVAGKLIGFALGVTSFLFLFKIIILDHTAPSDELAPGIVVMVAIVSGLLFTFGGHMIQNYMKRN